MTNSLYAAPFIGYSEYDFRNDQSIDMFEDVFWETSLPTYTYYDYLNLNKTFNSGFETNPKTTTLDNFFFTPSLQTTTTMSPTLAKAQPSSLRFYTNPVHLDDTVTSLTYLQQGDLFQFPLVSDLLDNDDTYSYYKNLLEYNNTYSSILLGTASSSLFPQTYLSVLNNFRGDYEDFS